MARQLLRPADCLPRHFDTMQASASIPQRSPGVVRPTRRVVTRAVAQDRTATLRQLLAKPGILLVRGGPRHRVRKNPLHCRRLRPAA